MGTGWGGRGGTAPHLRFCVPSRPLLGRAGCRLGRQRRPPLHGSLLLLLRAACAPPPARSQLPWEWATPGTAPSLSPAGPHPRPAAAHAGICVTRPRVGGSRSGEWSKSGISRCDSARGGEVRRAVTCSDSHVVPAGQPGACRAPAPQRDGAECVSPEVPTAGACAWASRSSSPRTGQCFALPQPEKLGRRCGLRPGPQDLAGNPKHLGQTLLTP